MHIAASLIWERIIEYRQVLDSIREYGIFEFQYSLNSREIGGS